MEDISITSWHVILPCGRELHGRELGSFRNIKHRKLLDLYVVTGAGKVFAERSRERRPIGFDFFVHVIMEEGGKVEKSWKLITIYDDRKIIKHVLPDGRNWMEAQCLAPAG